MFEVYLPCPCGGKYIFHTPTRCCFFLFFFVVRRMLALIGRNIDVEPVLQRWKSLCKSPSQPIQKLQNSLLYSADSVNNVARSLLNFDNRELRVFRNSRQMSRTKPISIESMLNVSMNISACIITRHSKMFSILWLMNYECLPVVAKYE